MNMCVIKYHSPLRSLKSNRLALRKMLATQPNKAKKKNWNIYLKKYIQRKKLWKSYNQSKKIEIKFIEGRRKTETNMGYYVDINYYMKGNYRLVKLTWKLWTREEISIHL